MRSFVCCLSCRWLYPFFCLLQAVETSQKRKFVRFWLTTVYGLDWPHKPATTEAGRKAQQQALLDIFGPASRSEF